MKEVNRYSPTKLKDLKILNNKCGDPKDRAYVKNFMKYFGYGNISNDEADSIWKHKELLYRHYCINNKMNKLSNGVDSLTKYLSNNSIPYSIASMAPEMNFDFYYKYTDISKYFNKKIIINDCDLYFRKKEMFIDAAKNMNIKISDCIVVEDSPQSIDQAIMAGVNKIIYINKRNRIINNKEIIQEVKNFKDINKNLFK